MGEKHCSPATEYLLLLRLRMWAVRRRAESLFASAIDLIYVYMTDMLLLWMQLKAMRLT
jgi:hypothetical protein